MLLSALGTLAAVGAVLQLLRTVLLRPDDDGVRARALLLGLCSPPFVYQTWSAHPDSLETALRYPGGTLTLPSRVESEPRKPRASWPAGQWPF